MLNYCGVRSCNGFCYRCLYFNGFDYGKSDRIAEDCFMNDTIFRKGYVDGQSLKPKVYYPEKREYCSKCCSYVCTCRTNP